MFPEVTAISTPVGFKQLGALQIGEKIQAPFGAGIIGEAEITAVVKKPFQGKVVKLLLKNGSELIATPDQPIFVEIATLRRWHTYVMFREQMGYRLGVTETNSGTRKSGTSHHRLSGEAADKMWLLAGLDTRSEAQFLEQKYSIIYGLPTWVFKARVDTGRNKSAYTQQLVNQLFEDIDTPKSFSKMAAEFGLMESYPHFMAHATTAGTGRSKINLQFFGDTRAQKTNPVSQRLHKININTGNENIVKSLRAMDFSVRSGRASTFRYETSQKNYHNIFKEACQIRAVTGSIIDQRSKLFPDGCLQKLLNIGGILPGWNIILKEGNALQRIEVVDKMWVDLEGEVVNLGVKNVECFFTNNIAVSSTLDS